LKEIKDIKIPSVYHPVDPQGLSEVELTDQQKEAIKAYRESLQPHRSIWNKIGRFLAGTSKAGRWASVVKDAALLFVPYGSKVDRITHFIVNELTKNKRFNTITAQNKTGKALYGAGSIVSLIFAILTSNHNQMLHAFSFNWLTLILLFVGILFGYLAKHFKEGSIKKLIVSDLQGIVASIQKAREDDHKIDSEEKKEILREADADARGLLKALASKYLGWESTGQKKGLQDDR
jgi:hypothetical protein